MNDQSTTPASGTAAGLSVAAGSAASLDLHEMFMECLREGYRLLMRGDVMHAGDEALRLHDRKWLPLPSGWDVGHPYDPKHWPPVRRKQPNVQSEPRPGGALTQSQPTKENQ